MVGNSSGHVTATLTATCPDGGDFASARVGGPSLDTAPLDRIETFSPLAGFIRTYNVPCGSSMVIGVVALQEVATPSLRPLNGCVNTIFFGCLSPTSAAISIAPAEYSLAFVPASVVGGQSSSLGLTRSPRLRSQSIYSIDVTRCGTFAPEANTTMVFSAASWSIQTSGVTAPTSQSYTAYSCATLAAVGSATLQIRPEQLSLLIRASLDGDPPGTAVSLPGNGTINARIPLGSAVLFEASDESGNPVPVSFALGSAELQAGVSSNGVLFRGKALIGYLPPAVNQGSFQAVHRGTVSVTVQPTVSGVSGGTIAITVENPEKLGTGGNSLDGAIYNIAHRTGVLPQFVKAHARKESYPPFDRLSYRYEPIGQEWVSDLDAVSNRPPNLRDVEPFKFYRLATQKDAVNDALAQGHLLNNADRDVRSAYLIGCDAAGAGGSPIGKVDKSPNPTAWEIVRCSDTQLKINWASSTPTKAPGRLRRIRENPFTAQTAIAASYGLLQMTFRRSIAKRLWPEGVTPHPSALLDTDANLAAGTGSLSLSTKDSALVFLNLWGNGVPDSPATLIARFRGVWYNYNSGEDKYAEKVAALAVTFVPTPQSPVFGQ